MASCHDGLCRPLTVNYRWSDTAPAQACVRRDGDGPFVIELTDSSWTGFPTGYNVDGHDDCICCDGFGSLDTTEGGVDISYVGLFVPCDAHVQGTCNEEHTRFHAWYRITGRHLSADKSGEVTGIKATFSSDIVPVGSHRSTNEGGDVVSVIRLDEKGACEVEWELGDGPNELRIATDIYAENLANFLTFVHRDRVVLSSLQIRCDPRGEWFDVEGPEIAALGSSRTTSPLVLSHGVFLSALDRWGQFYEKNQNLAEILIAAGTSNETGPVQELAVCTALEGLHRIRSRVEMDYRTRVRGLLADAGKVGFTFSEQNNRWLKSVTAVRNLHAHHGRGRRASHNTAIGWSVWWLAWITVVRHLRIPDAVIAASIRSDSELVQLKRTIMRPPAPPIADLLKTEDKDMS